MGEIITAALGNALGTIITTVLGAIVTGITATLGIYMRRVNNNLQRKMLMDEIKEYTSFMKQAPSFQGMTVEERIETIVETVREFANENGISVSDKSLYLMVEQSLQSFKTLEATANNLLMLKKMKNYSGEDNNEHKPL